MTRLWAQKHVYHPWKSCNLIPGFSQFTSLVATELLKTNAFKLFKLEAQNSRVLLKFQEVAENSKVSCNFKSLLITQQFAQTWQQQLCGTGRDSIALALVMVQ